MSPVTDETKIALLEKRMDDVEKFVESVPEKFVTKAEVETMIAQSMPSREDFKNDMAEVLTSRLLSERRETRSWFKDIFSIVITAACTGGGLELIRYLTSAH